MAKTSFYIDNQNRDFPFLSGTSFGSLSTVVACGFMLGHGTGFTPGVSTVFLAKILREHGRFWFYFESDAPGLAGKTLIFNRSEDVEDFVTEYADLIDDDPSSLSASDSASVVEDLGLCEFADSFAGFLITGSLVELKSLLSEGEHLLGQAIVEPALLQDLTGGYARSINLANGERTRYEPPNTCPDPAWPTTPAAMYVRATCIKGPVTFRPGYNSLILQNNFNNSLTIAAAVGAGLGEPCEQVPLFQGETPPDDSAFLEGGPSCAEAVRMVGGITGPIVPIASGNGVSVEFQPDLNTIKLNVDLHNLAVCSDDALTADEAEADFEHGGRQDITFPAFAMSGRGFTGLPSDGFGFLDAPAFSMSGTGHFADVFTGSGDLAFPAFVGDGSGVSATAEAGDGDAAFAPFSMAGSGSFSAHLFGFGDLTQPKFSMAGSGVFSSGSHFLGSAIRSIAYSGSRYVAVGAFGRASWSDDGYIWNPLTAGTTTGIKFGTGATAFGVAYGDGKFVTVGGLGLCSYSVDGINWTSIGNGASGIHFGNTGTAISIAYGNGRFVVVGNNGANNAPLASYSFDGINWIGLPVDATGIKFNSNLCQVVRYVGDRFMIGGTGGTASYSADAITWTTVGTGISGGGPGGTITGIARGGGLYVLVAGFNIIDGSTAYSLDGTTWTLNTTGGFGFAGTDGGGPSDLTYGNGQFVVVAYGDGSAYSSDGINWTYSTSTTDALHFHNEPAYTVIHDGTQFIAGGQSGRLAYSFNSILWRAEPNA
jgi:hypothetical protein